MIRSALGKVAWVGKTASMVFGLALVMALVFGVATTAIGVTGGNFILGKANTAGTPSSLAASIAKPTLTLINKSTDAAATALNISVDAGNPPLKVNATAGTATNLSADELDGRDSSAYQRRVSASCETFQNHYISAIEEDGSVLCDPDDDSGTTQVNQLKSDLGTNDGTPNESTDLVSFSEVKDIPADVVSRNADKLDGQDASAFASAGSAPLWAVVEGNGDIVQSKGVVSVLRIHVGYYKVVFNRDVDQCAYSAMPVWTLGPLYGFGVTVSPRDVSGENETPDTLYVNPYDDSGTQTDQRFHLIVYC